MVTKTNDDILQSCKLLFSFISIAVISPDIIFGMNDVNSFRLFNTTAFIFLISAFFDFTFDKDFVCKYYPVLKFFTTISGCAVTLACVLSFFVLTLDSNRVQSNITGLLQIDRFVYASALLWLVRELIELAIYKFNKRKCSLD